MLTKLAERSRNEKGFTLIELLVVILIIGILAAIALPAFLGQRAKGQDASAKSDARNVVSEMESCFTDSQTYVGCGTTAVSDAGATNTVVTAPTVTGYTITATSKSNNTFTIAKDAQGVVTRSCSSAGTAKGGCNSGSW